MKLIYVAASAAVVFYTVSLALLLLLGGRLSRVRGDIRGVAVYLSLVALLGWVVYVYYRLGPLPFGPDTASYTTSVVHVLGRGRWDSYVAEHYDPYYRLIHVPIAVYAVLAGIAGSLHVYPGLVAAVAFVAVASVSLFAARYREQVKLRAHEITVFSLLLPAAFYLATPPLGGLDLIPQVYSMALALAAVALVPGMLSPGGWKLRDMAAFTVLSIASVVSHLTAVIVILLVLALTYIESENRFMRMTAATAMLTILVFSAVYVTYVASDYAKFRNLYTALRNLASVIKSGLSVGNSVVIRAYTQVGGAERWIVSWTLLPSVFAAVTTLITLEAVLGRSPAGREGRHIRGLAAVMIATAALLALGVASRLAGSTVEILRYVLMPSYYLMYLVSIGGLTLYLRMRLRSSASFSGETVDAGRVSIVWWAGLALLAITLVVAVYSGLHDPFRSPWNGEPRLAPVALSDRVEVGVVCRYVSEPAYYVGVHDVYLDYDACKLLRPLVKDYYTMEALVKCVVNGLRGCGDASLRLLRRLEAPLLVLTWSSTLPQGGSFNLVAQLGEHAVVYVDMVDMGVEGWS